MEKLLVNWERMCASSALLQFVDINLRGVGQVMFQNNPLTGALFLAAIGWGSYAAGAPHVAIAGLLAVVIATLTAQWLRVDQEVASGRALWLQWHPCGACVGDIFGAERADVGVRGSGSGRVGCCDAWDR